MAARGEHKYKNSSDKHGHAHEASANKQCNSRQDVQDRRQTGGPQYHNLY